VKARWRLALVLTLCLLLALPMSIVQGAKAEVPPPKVMGHVTVSGSAGTESLSPPSNSTTPGTWFVGATPPNADLSKPPIVFVQGMNGKAQDWWSDTRYHGVNDMYELAYANGYRTAFVQLYDAAGNGSARPEDNGKLLAQMLAQISAYFGQKVNIVAHSKGGPDTQAALVEYGAYPYVNKVVTLSSPHYGSDLANLAYSWWAGWLADLLGQHSPGVYSLQTGEMEKYRQQIDSNPNVSKNAYFTAAGDDWGPFMSALWFGGLYLSQFGANDGMVNDWSTDLPYGRHLFTSHADHDSIRTGSASFSQIDPVLRTAAASSVVTTAAKPATQDTDPAADQTYVHGGPLTTGKTEVQTVPVETGLAQAVFAVLTKGSDVNVSLVSPSGKVYKKGNPVYSSGIDQDFFKGATVQEFRVEKPESGNWQVRLSSSHDDAYLLTTMFSGGEAASFSVDLPRRWSRNALPMSVRFKHPEKWDLAALQAQVKVLTSADMKNKKTKGLQFSLKPTQGSALSGAFKGAEPGVYNFTIEVRGKTKQGSPFARTIIRSVYIGN
jgi:hypothetical protein